MTEQQIDEQLRIIIPQMIIEEIEFLTANDGSNDDFDDETDDSEPLMCGYCRGSGIGLHGDPDHSNCAACRGTGDADFPGDDRPDPEDRDDLPSYFSMAREGR